MFVAGNKVNASDAGYFPMRPLGITAGSNNQSTGVLATGQPQPLAAFAVSDMGNRAGVEDIDVRLTSRGYRLVTGVSKLSRQKLGLGLIQLATDCIQGNGSSLPSCCHLIKPNTRAGNFNCKWHL
jgi:hypothetical protein